MIRSLSALWFAAFFLQSVPTPLSMLPQQPTIRRQPQLQRFQFGHVVEFQVYTGTDRSGGAGSDDQILIVFSNRSADGPIAPIHELGEDVIQQFAFSGRDARPGQAFLFSQRVPDLNFLQAQFIRVLNQGGDAWGGEWISLRVDGGPVLERQSLFPRKGNQPNGGLQMFNSRGWNQRSFWEGDLQLITQTRRYSGR